MIYGEIKGPQIENKLYKFKTDNINGYNCRILIGSQVIKQSYHFTEIQQLIIMSQPTSYSELIQIRGRAIRKDSHKNLPYEKQNVKIHILTISIPHKATLSIEEHKYMEKSNVYKTIQEIDKAIHEIAIDNYLFYDYVKDINELIAKPFKKTTLHLHDINTSMYSAFYNDDEIDMIVIIIKQLFLFVSNIWEINELWNAVINPLFYVSIDTKNLEYNNFIIALSKLSASNMFINNTIFDITKMIYYNKDYYYLTIKNNYIFLTKFNKIPAETVSFEEESIVNLNDVLITGDIDVEPWNNMKKNKYTFNIQNLLYLDENVQMEKLEYEFYNDYNNVAVERMPISLEYYNISFHYNNIQKIILYFINIYIYKVPKDSYYEFYTKCLIFYTKLDLIIYSDQIINTNEYSIYTKYVYSDKNTYETYDNPFLFSSQYRKKQKIIEENINKKSGKVLDILVPVGHFLSVDKTRLKYPIIYNLNTKTWIPLYDYFYNAESINENENPIIIGYYQIVPNYLDVKFKIRKPLQDIKKSTDNRLIEKGSICFTKTKEYLIELTKKLNLKVDSNKNKLICDIIKDELIKRELESIKDFYKKKKNTKVKWFYFQFENIPQV